MTVVFVMQMTVVQIVGMIVVFDGGSTCAIWSMKVTDLP